MLLPNRNKAYVPLPKLSGYLLSETHAVGKSKAKFFRALGFDDMNSNLPEQGLMTIAQNETVVEVVISTFGEKYIVDGVLETPSGTSVSVRTVWIVEAEEARPRFVTAYPI